MDFSGLNELDVFFNLKVNYGLESGRQGLVRNLKKLNKSDKTEHNSLYM